LVIFTLPLAPLQPEPLKIGVDYAWLERGFNLRGCISTILSAIIHKIKFQEPASTKVMPVILKAHNTSKSLPTGRLKSLGLTCCVRPD